MKMKKMKCFLTPLLALALLVGCTTYEPKVYGPVEFEIDIEGPLFEGGVAEGITTVKFNPEDFGISRDEVFSMKVNEIVLSTEAEGGLGAFENIVFSVMTDDTETKEVASVKIEGNPKELVIPGLNEAEIEGFKTIKEFYLEIVGISKAESFDDIKLKGTIKMDVMIPEKK
jgi:hypothetical protein